MTRLVVRPGDRMHMLVWRSRTSGKWCAVRALNGTPINFALSFSSWAEAVAYAIQEAY